MKTSKKIAIGLVILAFLLAWVYAYYIQTHEYRITTDEPKSETPF